MIAIIPKIEYALILDPELNEGNKYYGIRDMIAQHQEAGLAEVVFPNRIIVHKKLVDFLKGKPYEFTLDNTGLDSTHNGIVKIHLTI
jgi:hypothetical protein